MTTDNQIEAPTDLSAMTKSTNQQLLDLLLPRAVSAAERQQIELYVREKSAFSKKQSLFLAMVASRNPG